MHLPHRWPSIAWLHVLRRVLLATLFLVLGFLAYGAYQAYQLYDAVSKTVAVVPRSTVEPTVDPSPFNGHRRINILVLGSDNDKKSEEKRPLSQSMIVVSIDPVHDKVTMLSIPRDFWVPIRGHGMGKIDLAYKYGGVQLARETVEKVFHIGINYYTWVGLNGFIRVINTFNGVTLDVSHPILDDTYPNDLNARNPYGYKRVFIPAGWQHMDGSQALEYVRSRHGDRIGDFGRSARQQEVLLQLRAKATTLNLLANLFTLADELRSSVRTDVKPTDYLDVERLSRTIRPQDIEQQVLSFPNYCNYGWRQGQSVLLPYWNKIYPLTRRLFAPISTAPGPVRRVPQSVPRRGASTATPRPQPAITATTTPRATPTPVPTATAVVMHRLPARILFIRSGNLFQLLRTGAIRRLTYTGDVEMPAPAPRGGFIAIVRSPTFAYASDLWLLNPRTLRMKKITRDTYPHELRNNQWVAWPTWTSDGTTLDFSYDRYKLATPPSESRPVDLALYSMPVARDAPTQLTRPAIGAGGDTEPAARPGSSQVAYVRWDYNQNTNQPYSQLAIYDPKRPGPVFLTPQGGRILDPAWDPAGRRLAYVRRTNGIDEIAVATYGQTSRGPVLGARVVLASGRVGQPSFSPDGRWISFVRAQEDGFALYVAPATGGKPFQVSEVGASLDGRWRPVWMR